MFDILVYVFENYRQTDVSSDPERLAERRQDEVRVVHGAERDEGDAVRVLLDELARRLEREARLPCAARTGERDDPMSHK